MSHFLNSTSFTFVSSFSKIGFVAVACLCLRLTPIYNKLKHKQAKKENAAGCSYKYSFASCKEKSHLYSKQKGIHFVAGHELKAFFTRFTL